MIAIIDSGIGNIKSVANAFAHLKADFIVTTKKEDLKKPIKLFFPELALFVMG